MKKIIFLLPMLMGACASLTPQQYTAAMGKTGYTLTCSAFNTTWEQCQRKAAAACTEGFELDKALSFKETFADSGDGFYKPPNYHLAVVCKNQR